MFYAVLLIRLLLRRIHLPHWGRLTVNDAFLVRTLMWKFGCFFGSTKALPYRVSLKFMGLGSPMTTKIRLFYRRAGACLPPFDCKNSIVHCGRFLNRPYDDCVIFCRGHSRMTRGEPYEKRCLSCSSFDRKNLFNCYGSPICLANWRPVIRYEFYPIRLPFSANSDGVRPVCALKALQK